MVVQVIAIAARRAALRAAAKLKQIKKEMDAAKDFQAKQKYAEDYFKAKDNASKAELKYDKIKSAPGTVAKMAGDAGGGASKAGSAVLTILTITLIAFPIALMSGFLDDFGGRGARVFVESKVNLQPIKNIPSQFDKMFTGLTQNPFEETTTVETTTSTQTAVGTGLKVSTDTVERTGILSPNPRSQQEYTIIFGVKNPTNDFIGENSQLFLGNEGNVTEKTGLKFAPFAWDGGVNTAEPKGYNNYISATATSTTNAVKVANVSAVGPTNLEWEVDYAYTFKPAYEDVFAPFNSIIMYHAKFLVSSYQWSTKINAIKEKYKIKDEVAGGPVKIERINVEPYLEPGKRVNLIFTLKKSPAESGVIEAIDFEPSALLGIALVVPDEFTDPQPSSKYTCNDIVTAPYAAYKVCEIGSHAIFPDSNIDYLRSIACGKDGCLFNNYDAAQGFFPGSRLLTDLGGQNEAGFSISFKVDPAIDPDKVYNVYLFFLEGAYKYHAAVKKGMGVQPG